MQEKKGNCTPLCKTKKEEQRNEKKNEMQRRLVATGALSRVRNNGQKVAGYGETSSAGAWTTGRMCDGRLARIGVAVAYEFRGRDAHVASSAEDHSQFRHHNRGSGRAAFFDPPSAHVWWPEQVHLCAAMASVCAQVGASALSELSGSELTPDAESDQRVVDVAHRFARTHMRGWGVLPLVTVAGVWPLSDDSGLPCLTGRPFSAATCIDTHPWGAVKGLPSAAGPMDDESRAFFDHTMFRSDALCGAVATGHHPYSYDAVRLMFRHLVQSECLAAHQGRSTDTLKAMRLQLYVARRRLGPQQTT